MAYNFGYEFRTAWIRNYIFVALALFFTITQFYITLNPGSYSCIWRVNCVNDNVVRAVTDMELPLQTEFATTVMPAYFQRGILGLMIGNAIAIAAYDYYVVNGIRQYFAAKKREKLKAEEAVIAKSATNESKDIII